MAALKRSAAPGFGKPGSIDPARLFKLPLAMQAEGIRLLFEMGLSMNQVKKCVGLSTDGINLILQKSKPFTRGGDASIVTEGVS
ncbi:hypothetical protein [Mesorhizobium sp. M0195]|uniref:hypothetical protein n=1 Tax=Mesorhizobium sp. M0195 TaxID=2956910 RepID=UPI0033385AFF